MPLAFGSTETRRGGARRCGTTSRCRPRRGLNRCQWLPTAGRVRSSPALRHHEIGCQGGGRERIPIRWRLQEFQHSPVSAEYRPVRGFRGARQLLRGNCYQAGLPAWMIPSTRRLSGRCAGCGGLSRVSCRRQNVASPACGRRCALSVGFWFRFRVRIRGCAVTEDHAGCERSAPIPLTSRSVSGRCSRVPAGETGRVRRCSFEGWARVGASGLRVRGAAGTLECRAGGRASESARSWLAGRRPSSTHTCHSGFCRHGIALACGVRPPPPIPDSVANRRRESGEAGLRKGAGHAPPLLLSSSSPRQCCRGANPICWLLTLRNWRSGTPMRLA